jgi:hypothetical protein
MVPIPVGLGDAATVACFTTAGKIEDCRPADDRPDQMPAPNPALQTACAKRLEPSTPKGCCRP